MSDYLPEENLWAAVINQAIKDALGEPTSSTHSPTALDIERTRIWLTRPNPQFDYVCELAGKDPTRTRKAVVAMLAKKAARAAKPKRADARTRSGFACRAGGSSDLENVAGTGGGSTAQDFPETDFSHKDTNP